MMHHCFLVLRESWSRLNCIVSPNTNRGTTEVWMFRLCDTSQSQVLGVMCNVQDRTAQSKITLQKWLFLMHWWSRQYSVKDAAEEAGVSEPTAIQIYARLRDVCSYRVCTIDPPIRLGGQGVVVAID